MFVAVAQVSMIELGERATPAASVYRFKIQGRLLLLERSSGTFKVLRFVTYFRCREQEKV